MTPPVKDSATLYHPGKGRGLLDVPKYRYLLELLVNKEVRVRYRGSKLGMIWTYIKPLTQFVVFYVAMGIFLGLNKAGNIENYAVYMFSGTICANFFNEVFSNSTRSIMGNSGLIKKIYMPRELFPLASLRVALIHFYPQVLVLVIGSALLGWLPDFKGLVIGVFGFLSLTLCAFGLGLFFGAFNVFYRDAENITDLVSMIVVWMAPCFYTWQMVADKAPNWALQIYLATPVSAGVEAFHRAFWWGGTSGAFQFAPGFAIHLVVAFGIGLAALVLGELAFRHYEGRFAQEL